MEYQLEICVDSVRSLRNAEEGGADRIELCQALELGGLTASYGLMRKVKEVANVPVFAMIRPRPGNFVYDETELSIMKENIRVASKLGINGFVFGALKYDRGIKGFEIDRDVCHTLINESCGKQLTFHRAFDSVKHPLQGISDLIDIGFNRVLTSGQAATAYEGRQNIKTYVEKAGKELIIMPGCGLNDTNLEEMITDTGAKEFHASCSRRFVDFEICEEGIVKGATYYYITCTDIVKDMATILKSR